MEPFKYSRKASNPQYVKSRFEVDYTVVLIEKIEKIIMQSVKLQDLFVCFKATVQRKITGVESGTNQWVLV